jgi:hypothetical protein
MASSSGLRRKTFTTEGTEITEKFDREEAGGRPALYFGDMKTVLIAMMFGVGVSLYAAVTTPVALAKAAQALTQAHNVHDMALKACNLKPEHEIGWNFIEGEVKGLAYAHDLPAASKIVDVLGDLRVERRALMHDFVGCAFKLGETQTSLAVLKAMDALDDVAADIETNIRNRTWNMEKGLDYCKTHLAN